MRMYTTKILPLLEHGTNIVKTQEKILKDVLKNPLPSLKKMHICHLPFPAYVLSCYISGDKDPLTHRHKLFKYSVK